MNKVTKTLPKVIMAGSIALTGFASTAVLNEAHAANGGYQPGDYGELPKDLKTVHVKYTAKQVKQIDKDNAIGDDGFETAKKMAVSSGLAAIAPEFGIGSVFAQIGMAQWQSDYAKHFHNAAEKNKGLTISYTVDLNTRMLESVKFSE